MADQVIPVVEVSGSHRAVGEGIGEATGAALRESLAELGDLEPLRSRARPFDAAVRRHLPEVAAELDGCARGAGVEPIDLVVLGTEELFSGCSDVAATAPATAGETIVAHTNDLAPRTEARLTAIVRRVTGEPAIFTVGVGPFPSIALNDAGLALGGNQLDANDEREGIPRLLLVRRLVAARTSGAAIVAALHPARASSYNNLIAHRDGTLVSVEATATAHGFVDAAGSGGVTAHTNHYTLPALERFELDQAATAGSRSRLRRAWELLDGRSGLLGEADLLGFIRDHEGDPQPICRHAGETSRTVFWCVLNPTAGRVRYGRGTPCTGDGVVFSF